MGFSGLRKIISESAVQIQAARLLVQLGALGVNIPDENTPQYDFIWNQAQEALSKCTPKILTLIDSGHLAPTLVALSKYADWPVPRSLVVKNLEETEGFGDRSPGWEERVMSHLEEAGFIKQDSTGGITYGDQSVLDLIDLFRLWKLRENQITLE